MLNPAPPLLGLLGTTAVGKSAVALTLAEHLDGEIVSVDSMQVYRGLDIGTAKPSAADRARVAHHLLDVVALDQSFDAARFVTLARAAVTAIQARGRRPILCGGTGLYWRAWLEGLGVSPPSNPALRAELEALPLPELRRELERRDPTTFHEIDLANPRRVIRAVEVIRLTGRPFSAQRAPWSSVNATRSAVPVAIYGLVREPTDLRRRIDARVEAMFAAGLVRETQALLEQGLSQNRTARQAIGYRQVAEHLAGRRGLPETVALVKSKTWQFARRQATWFRHQLPVTWLAVAPDEPVDRVVERLLCF